MDLLTGNQGSVNLLENTMPADNNYFDLKLEALYGNKFAVGSRVKVYAGNDVYEQEINLGRGQLMQEPYRLHFGIGKNTDVKMVAVRWYGNKYYTEYSVVNGHTFAINSINKIVQEEGSNIEEIKTDSNLIDVSFYPNPATDMVTFKISDNPYINLKLEIYNSLGQHMKNIEVKGNESVKWNFTDESGNILSTGVYTCKFVSESGAVKTVRVLKM